MIGDGCPALGCAVIIRAIRDALGPYPDDRRDAIEWLTGTLKPETEEDIIASRIWFDWAGIGPFTLQAINAISLQRLQLMLRQVSRVVKVVENGA